MISSDPLHHQGTLVVVWCVSRLSVNCWWRMPVGAVYQSPLSCRGPGTNFEYRAIEARRTSLPESNLRSPTRPWFCLRVYSSRSARRPGGNSDFWIQYFSFPATFVWCVLYMLFPLFYAPHACLRRPDVLFVNIITF